MASSTDLPKRAGIWKTIPTRRRSSSGSSPLVGSPSRKTSPEVGSMRRLMARSRVLFPAPEGPTTAVTPPSRIAMSTSFRISVPPIAYSSPEISIFREGKLERLPPQVYVEAVEDGVSVKRQGLVVGEGLLHAPDHGVQPIGLGAPVHTVHEVGVVDYLGDLSQHGIVQIVLFEHGLEGAGVAAVGEPGSGHVEELCPFGRLRSVPEEVKLGVGVDAAPDQPHAGRPTYVTSPPGCPQHYPAPSCTARPAPLFTARRASRI